VIAIGVSSLISPEVAYFPGSYFEAVAKSTLQRRAMTVWPGPSQLVRRWQDGLLSNREKMAVLVGGSASHDPVLLPLYREAVMSENPRLRMAAAYGYRDLLGDGLPNLSAGVSPDDARRLAAEMDAVAATLRERPLVEFWLQAALSAEDRSMPGWSGVVLRRPPGICFRAVDQVVSFDDFEYLAAAFRISAAPGSRFALMRLMEAATLSRFYLLPQGQRAGSGTKETNEAITAASEFIDLWVDTRCRPDPSAILKASLVTLGVRGVDPFAVDSYWLWLQVLRRGEPPWRAMAARRLYELGGRWSSLSILQAESPGDLEAWEELVSWYRLWPSHSSKPDRAGDRPLH